MLDVNDLLREALNPRKKKVDPVLDGASAPTSAAGHAQADIRLSVAAAIQQWCETDDLADGETSADRLMALMIGVADENHDGELSDAEQAVVEVALNAAFDYLVSMGASEDDAAALLNDWDAGVADRVKDLVCAALPEGDEAAGEQMDAFAFGAEAQEPMLDAAAPAGFKKVVAVRHGKKQFIHKRISGVVHRSGAQKLATKKARIRSQSAGAKMRRLKSFKLGQKMGVHA